MIVEVQPAWQRVAPLGFRRVEPRLRPAICERAVETLNLPAGLRPTRARPLVDAAKPGAGIAPGERLVGRPVVREHSLDDDTVLREPGNHALEDADGSDDLLIRTDLGVGDAGVVIDGPCGRTPCRSTHVSSSHA